MIDRAGLDELARAGAATVCAANGERGDVSPRIGAMTGGLTVAGRAFCVACDPADNLAIHRAVAEASQGEILVVAGHGSECGYIGDILAVAAMSRGVVGAVVDGSVRDLAELRKLQFPVWASGLAIRSASKKRPGSVAVDIEIGGVGVSPGDIVVADDDGVCVVALADAAAVLEATRTRAAAEVRVRARLREGETTLDLLNLRRLVRSDV